MIILLNGSINSGKSTVARLLAKRLRRPAVVEPDSLHAFIDWVEIDRAVPLNLENAAAVILNFVRERFNVVMPYPLSNADHAHLVGRLADSGAEIRAFTLKPSLEKALSSSFQRVLSDWERERIAHHYASDVVAPKFGEILDSTLQTPEETAQWILERLPASVTWPFEARRATPLDEDALWQLQLHREAWLAQKAMPSLAASVTVDQQRAFLRDHLKNSEVWVFSRQGRVVGQVRLQASDEAFWGEGSKGEAGYVHGLSIAEDAHGKGVGLAILSWAEEVFKDRGKTRLRLDCASANKRLCRYYEEAGYVDCGGAKLSNGWEARRFEKALNRS